MGPTPFGCLPRERGSMSFSPCFWKGHDCLHHQVLWEGCSVTAEAELEKSTQVPPLPSGIKQPLCKKSEATWSGSHVEGVPSRSSGALLLLAVPGAATVHHQPSRALR
ncbi:unnamed protein product [Rangifer tarandus platyrhynchus]|uniref:Uncharacterized protein n=2 Tax=Rangifer tarandus platyrhynchus TaxID=3082113 RepID=A0AC59ZDQ5_RANTA|nr:unnamed protein product [Rangifer tarandus platyrhynchus]